MSRTNALQSKFRATVGRIILLSSTTANAVVNQLGADFQLKSLGKYHLKGCKQPEEIFQLSKRGLRNEFPAPRVLPAVYVVAVLPFQNKNHDPENDYLSDGIRTLARLPGIRVVARAASSVFISSEKEVQRIGKLLNANGVLFGEMQKVDDQIKLSVKLKDVDLHQERWSDQFNDDLKGVFAMEDAITKRIAESY